MYLPAAAQDLLFDRIHDLAAPGSRIAVEGLGPEFFFPERRALRRERMDRVRELMAETDSQLEVPTVDELWYFEEREDVGDWLRRRGWDVSVTPSDGTDGQLRAPISAELDGAASRHTYSSPRSESPCDSTQLTMCCLVPLR